MNLEDETRSSTVGPKHGKSARTGTPSAVHPTESTANTERLMEEVVERKNLMAALKKVRSNKGAPGVDGMTVDELGGYLKEHWPAIRESLLAGTCKPKPVKRVEIPKPDGSGVRKLGIPTVLDRFIQQAVLQVLQPRWDPTFSASSFGFRPGRSAHGAIAKAQEHIAQGHAWVVDIDLEKFFDRVNHDRLMGEVAKRVKDKRMLKLLRGFLNAGVMENGLVSPTVEGTPQGGPLSPLLSNLVLDELDKELERRGHRFVRYADDCNIYVRSKQAGQRVMESVTRFITNRLKLRVNGSKSATGKAGTRKFLGFRISGVARPKRRIAEESLERFKRRIRELTRRTRGRSIEHVVRKDLAPYLRGWGNYFGYCETPEVLKHLDSWIRRRLRSYLWKQWGHWHGRYRALVKLGISVEEARTASCCRAPWRASRSKIMAFKAAPPSYFCSLGLPTLYVKPNA
jgi:RNA-directed DNA polymerase